MKKIKVTFYLSPEDYAYLRALMVTRMKNNKLPKLSDIICEAIRKLK